MLAGAAAGVLVTLTAALITVPALVRATGRRLGSAALAWFVAAVALGALGALGAAVLVGESTSGFLTGLMVVILFKLLGAVIVDAVRRRSGRSGPRGGYLPLFERGDPAGDLANAVLGCPLWRPSPDGATEPGSHEARAAG